MSTTKCIRLRRNDLCRLDLKPCRNNCPLRKTKEEQRLYLEEVEDNKLLLQIEACRSMARGLSEKFKELKKI